MFMVTVLLGILIIVVLFKDGIKKLITNGILLFVAFALWNTAWWGMIIAVLIYIGIIYEILEPIFKSIGSTIKWFRNRSNASKPEIDAQPDQAVYGQTAAASPSINEYIDVWYYSLNGKTSEPLTEPQLLNLLRKGHLPHDTPIRHHMVNDWTPANRLWAVRLK
ncbi:GYF domain-containing protein [Cohnella massiliensis]|uniref:GYF domain-containing protein n=1 Tax=Cohnella massiliensis TaxID=1816691 RepID=UPI0009BBC22C|nr:GYF domain-containing protein [Cohnella massiliensis]